MSGVYLSHFFILSVGHDGSCGSWRLMMMLGVRSVGDAFDASCQEPGYSDDMQLEDFYWRAIPACG